MFPKVNRKFTIYLEAYYAKLMLNIFPGTSMAFIVFYISGKIMILATEC